MNKDSMGTNEKGLDSLILELSNISETIASCLSSMETLINDTSLYFQGDVADSLRNKFSNIILEFPVINSNLESFKNDFINIKNNHIGFDINFNTSTVEKTTTEGGDYSGVN